jgi:hypothetical protein
LTESTVFDSWDFDYAIEHRQLFDEVMQDADNFFSRLSNAQSDYHVYEPYGDVVSEVGFTKFGETQLIYSEHENDVSFAPHSQSEITEDQGVRVIDPQ